MCNYDSDRGTFIWHQGKLLLNMTHEVPQEIPMQESLAYLIDIEPSMQCSEIIPALPTVLDSAEKPILPNGPVRSILSSNPWDNIQQGSAGT